MLCNIVENSENCTVAKSCPDDFEYTKWSQWSDCKSSCRRGIEDKRNQNRTRKCPEKGCKKAGKMIYDNLYIRDCELVYRPSTLYLV